MRKMKTETAIKKRFRITKNGKVMAGHQNGRHLRANKSKSQKRRMKEPGQIYKAFAKKYKKIA